MQNIQDLVLKNYQDNMTFFKEKHPTLHNKLLALDTILGNGSYPQKYDLEYKDEYFDIVELSTHSYLYNKNSKELSNDILNSVSYKKSDQTFKSYRQIDFEEHTLNFLKEANPYINFATVAEIFSYYDSFIDNSTDMSSIFKYIFFGTGLGIHIEKIINKFDIQVALIIEDDIELFRLSLFTTNYKNIFENLNVYFSISENKAESHQTFNNFFTTAFLKNQYIKFNMFSSIYEEKINDIKQTLISRPEATYSNERLLVKNKRVIKKLNQNYKFIDMSKKEDETFFNDKPCLVLGAGPSLYDNAEWVKENQDKFIIIAAFSALKTLQRVNIVPDVIAHIDEDDFKTVDMLNNLNDISFLSDSVVFLAASVSKTLFEHFDKNNIYLHEDRTHYKLTNDSLIVASVGETIYAIALMFNPSNIYLLGLDLSVKDDGIAHSKDHFRATTLEDEDNNQNDFDLRISSTNIKGNLKDIVKTVPIFALSIPGINRITFQLKSDNQKIYNLSSIGAYFENTIPLKIEDVHLEKVIEKKNLKDNLIKIFDNYSSSSLSNYEYDAIKYKLDQIADFHNTLNIFKNSAHSNHEYFINSYINLITSMIDHSCQSELKEIMKIFYLRISPFIDDFIYTKELKNKKKHLKKLKQMISVQVEKIISAYEVDLKLLK